MTREELQSEIFQIINETTWGIVGSDHVKLAADRVIRRLEKKAESTENLFDPGKSS